MLRVLLLSTFCVLLHLVIVQGTLSEGGNLRDNETPAFDRKPLEDLVVAAKEGTKRELILGLLGARQSCASGYGQCRTTGSCCPVGGDCCKGGDCCRPGNWCWSSGCCKNSQDGCENKCMPKGAQCCSDGSHCDSGYDCVIFDSGRRGCCPKGKLCSDPGSDTCEDDGYVPCKNDNFCCPSGYICYRDSAGARKCHDPDSGPTSDQFPTATHTENPTTTTFNGATTTTSPATFTIPSPTFSSLSIAGSNSNTAILDLNSAQIKWEGSWTAETSPCNSSAVSKKVSGSSAGVYSMSVSFTSSAFVEMSIQASNDITSTISVNGVSYQTYQGTPNANNSTASQSNCSYTFSYDYKLSVGQTSWTLDVKVTSQAVQNGRRDPTQLEERQAGDRWLQVNQIRVQQTTSTSSSALSPTSTPSVGYKVTSTQTLCVLAILSTLTTAFIVI